MSILMQIRKNGKSQRPIYTFFLFSIHDYWFLVTAGHCIGQF